MKDIRYIHARNNLKRAMASCQSDRVDWQASREEVIKQIFDHNKNGDFLSLSLESDNMVSYKKPGADYEFRYDTRCRIKTTLARYITRRIGGCENGNLSDLVSTVNGKLWQGKIDTRFDLLSGDDIQGAYKDSVGDDSCMTGSDSDKVELYAVNPGKVKLLCFLDEDGEKAARALLWTCDDGTQILDRIYPNTGNHLGFYSDYCHKHKIAMRSNNSLPDKSNISYGMDLCVTMELPESMLIPYMDTFVSCNKQYYNEVVMFNNYSGDYETQCTEGGPFAESFKCTHCGDRIDNENYFSTECSDGCYCESCYSELFTYCEGCQTDCFREDSVWIADIQECYCEHCASSNTVCCDGCGQQVLNSTETANGDNVCENCIDNYSCCDDCGEYYKQDEMQSTPGGNCVCDACFNENYFTCDDCGEVFNSDEVCFKSEKYVCIDCQQKESVVL